MDLSPFVRKLSATAAVAAIFCLCSGCDERKAAPDRLTVVRGADQCSTDGRFPEAVRVEARRGKVPVPGVKLVFNADPGSPIEFSPSSGTTDGGGAVAVKAAAQGTGDRFFTVTAPEHPACAPLRLRLAAGMELIPVWRMRTDGGVWYMELQSGRLVTVAA